MHQKNKTCIHLQAYLTPKKGHVADQFADKQAHEMLLKKKGTHIHFSLLPLCGRQAIDFLWYKDSRKI